MSAIIVSKPTRTELEILACVRDGMTTEQAAERLDMNLWTARTHVFNVLRRLHVHTRTAAVVTCIRKGWLAP